MRRIAVMTGALCAVVCLVAGGECAARAWYIRTVESAGEVGYGTSIAVDDGGRPHISYYDNTNLTLKYAVWNGTSWHIQTVDTTTYGTWSYTSLALDGSAYPHIAYTEWAYVNLKYARWNGSGWDIQNIAYGGQLGSDRAITLTASGLPRIAYELYPDNGLMYATSSGSGWDVQTVENDGGCRASVALDSSGHPHIAHHTESTGEVRYAEWNGTTWLCGKVDDASLGIFSCASLVLDASDCPHIGYCDKTSRTLKYAVWDGASWSIDSVDSTYYGDGFGDTSLALDHRGHPHMAYWEVADGIKYATWDGSSWATGWLDGPGGDVGDKPSIAIDKDGELHVSYFDWDNYALRYATTRPFAEASHELSAAGYYMISLPLTPPPGTTVHEVLCDDLGCGDYHMWRWDGGRYYAVRTSWPGCQYPTLSSQRGYWLLAPAASIDIDVGGTLASGDQVIPLQPGWNMIGAPHEAPMDSLLVDNAGDVRGLADAESAGWVLGTFYYSDDGTGTYRAVAINQTPPERLCFWHGYWVLAALDCSLIIPDPSIGGTTSAGPRQPARPAVAWAFDIEAGSGTSTDSITIAAATAASDDFDGFALDKPKPPAAPGEGALRIALTGVGRGCLSPPASAASSLSPTSELAMDTRCTAQNAPEWEFTVTGGVAGEPVALTWPELARLPKDKVAILVDRDTGKRTFMRTRAQYEFAAPGPGATRDFSVSVKPAQQAGLRVTSFSVVPLRGGRGAEIAFSLSGEATVDIRILNVAGRLVERVRDAYTVEAGTHTVAWDGRSLGGTALPNGTYLCILKARTADGEQASAVRCVRVVR